MTIESKPTSVLLVEGYRALRNDYPVAIGALAVGNELLQQVAQRLFESRHLLAALLEVGNRHLDEVHAIVDSKTQPASDDDASDVESDEAS